MRHEIKNSPLYIREVMIYCSDNSRRIAGIHSSNHPMQLICDSVPKAKSNANAIPHSILSILPRPSSLDRHRTIPKESIALALHLANLTFFTAGASAPSISSSGLLLFPFFSPLPSPLPLAPSPFPSTLGFPLVSAALNSRA